VSTNQPDYKTIAFIAFGCLLFFCASQGFAQTTGGNTGFADACKNVEGFFKNFETILKVISVTVVTIAIIFAGYQIAFAHKRLSDVAPILIGGLLIGGAATIALWFVGEFTGSC
jgi:type IV secretion system protein VirB2